MQSLLLTGTPPACIWQCPFLGGLGMAGVLKVAALRYRTIFPSRISAIVLSRTVVTRYSPAKAVEYIFSVLAGDRECKNLSLKFFRPFSGSGRTSVTASLSSFHHLSYT